MNQIVKSPRQHIAAIIPQNVEDVFRLAKGIAASGLAPKDMSTPEQISVAIMHGLEIGLPPMQAVQRIAVVNGRPTIWGDAIPALLWSRGFAIREWSVEGTAHCEITRPDGIKGERTFSKADAKTAGLLGKPGPWQQYPERMLQMRARGYAARDFAADVLSGLYLREELEDVPAEPRDITPAEAIEPPKPRKSSSAAKKDGTTETFNEIKAAIAHANSKDMLLQVRKLFADDWETLPARWHALVEEDFQVKMEVFEAVA